MTAEWKFDDRRPLDWLNNSMHIFCIELARRSFAYIDMISFCRTHIEHIQLIGNCLNSIDFIWSSIMAF